ncbi:hypothetical protein MRX96_044336 [Rhipicephalus microplus]
MYVTALQDTTIMRLLKEVSQVYQTIEIKRLLELAPFANAFYLENMVVDAVRRNDLQVRIDHKRRCLHFSSELSVSQQEEVVEGPHLQGMPSEQIRCQLVKLYSVLQRSVHLIRPKRSRQDSTKELKMNIIDAYRLVCKKEHKKILERQQIIEACKEMLENLTFQREEEERKQMEERQQKMREAEEERIVREAEEHAKQRSQREQDEMKKKVVLE